ncbi:hypothetical protein DRJ22_01585 [Candidatus Woesearchaeota archaeon]|nr:MAG: hypothetical protein B6U93_04660 [Candidatus Woesearchaeota archaeon ex4484_78]RLE46583.1 MAG: hypothetical protein DRJ22_01585 [Candidatus Woesearchaeota archaeon]
MKTLFIPAKSNVDIRLTRSALAKLPKKRFGLVTTIQHLHKLQDVQKQLKDSVLVGQILGCNVLKTEKAKVDAFLFVGTGEFHPLNLARHTEKPVWTWNPVSKVLKQISKSETTKFKKKMQGLLNRFLHAETIGVLVSLKPGQFNLRLARDFIKHSKKNCYLFLCDNVVPAEFENFPFIDFWVNTACPRLIEDSDQMINIDDLISQGLFKASGKQSVIWKTMV